MYMTNEQVARIAATLGHTDLSIAQTPAGRWFASCSCGYRSTNKVRQHHAAVSAAHHVQVIAQRYAAAGYAIPDGKGADAPAAAPSAA